MNGIASGPLMMMKALGFDPQAIMGTIESARTSANEIMKHFDARLQVIEAQNAKILSALEFLLKDDSGVQ